MHTLGRARSITWPFINRNLGLLCCQCSCSDSSVLITPNRRATSHKHSRKQIYARAMSSTLPAFQYDILAPGRFRLFKLDLNPDNQDLSGQLLSTYHIQNNLDLSLSYFKYVMSEDTTPILSKTSNGEGYHALSYCWGAQNSKQALRLSTIGSKLKDDEVQMNFEPERNGTIQITQSLYDLLQELRRRSYNWFVWIDAICINESSDEEKSLQLPMMRDIYEYSDRVLVWLGPATNMANEALAMISSLADILQKASENSHILNPEIPDTFHAIDLPEPSNIIWEAVRDLFCRPWWSRLWTLQEVTLAPIGEGVEEAMASPSIQVLCGDTTATIKSLDSFALVATSTGIKDWILTGQSGASMEILNGFDSIDEIRTCRESFSRHGWGISLNALLLATRRRQAAVPADMVIGMLGMLDAHARLTLAIDIGQTTESVFIKFGKFYIRNEPKEMLLNHVATRERLACLPSWCPNFASPPETISLGTRWLGHLESTHEHRAQMYCAGFQKKGKWTRPRSGLYYVKNITNALIWRHPHSGVFDTNNTRQIALLPNTDSIVASGIPMETVVAVVDCNPAAESTKFLSFNGVQDTNEWDVACLALAKQTLSPDVEGYDVYARTIVANRVTINPRPDEPFVFDRDNELNFVARYLALKRYMQAVLALGESIPEEGNLDEDTIRYTKVLQQISRRRRFFATSAGRIGLGPADTEVGDTICIIFYCPTPYILRNAKDGKFNLVGEAFVHGLMYGEALAMFDQNKVKETKWVIE